MLPKSVIEPSLGSCVLHGAGSGPNDVDDGRTGGGSWWFPIPRLAHIGLVLVLPSLPPPRQPRLDIISTNFNLFLPPAMTDIMKMFLSDLCLADSFAKLSNEITWYHHSYVWSSLWLACWTQQTSAAAALHPVAASVYASPPLVWHKQKCDKKN